MTYEYVYFIQARYIPCAPVKIGRSAKPWQRLQDLQVGCPDELEVVTSVLTDDAKNLERSLHAEFAATHIRGEWFKFTADLWDRIVELCITSNAPEYHS